MIWFITDKVFYFSFENKFYIRVKVVNTNTAIISFFKDENYDKIISVPFGFTFSKLGGIGNDKDNWNSFFVSRLNTFQLFYDKKVIITFSEYEIKTDQVIEIL